MFLKSSLSPIVHCESQVQCYSSLKTAEVKTHPLNDRCQLNKYYYCNFNLNYSVSKNLHFNITAYDTCSFLLENNFPEH